ncbi:MAG: hypothetical protein ACKO3H_11070 [Verrucomicrobiota bacterium]
MAAVSESRSVFSVGTEAYGDVRARFEVLRTAFLGLCQEAENRSSRSLGVADGNTE